MTDIDLVFGVAGGGSVSGDSGSVIYTDLSNIVKEINSNPFEIKFKVDSSSEESIKNFGKSIQDVIEGFKTLSTSAVESLDHIRSAIDRIQERLGGISGTGNTPIINFGTKTLDSEVELAIDKAYSYINALKEVKARAVEAFTDPEGAKRYTRMFGIEAFADAQQHVVKYSDAIDKAIQTLEVRLSRSGNSKLINNILNDAKSQFSLISEYVDKMVQVGANLGGRGQAGQEKLDMLFGRNQGTESLKSQINEESQSIEALNKDYEHHKSVVEEATAAESAKAVDSKALSEALHIESQSLNETTSKADEVKSAFQSLLQNTRLYFQAQEKLATLNPLTQQNKIDEVIADMTRYQKRIDSIKQQYGSLFSKRQTEGAENLWNELSAALDKFKQNLEAVAKYKSVMKDIEELSSKKAKVANLDPQKDADTIATLTARITELGNAIKKVQLNPDQFGLNKEQIDSINKSMMDLNKTTQFTADLHKSGVTDKARAAADAEAERDRAKAAKETAKEYERLMSLVDQYGNKQNTLAGLDPTTSQARIEKLNEELRLIDEEMVGILTKNKDAFNPDLVDAFCDKLDTAHQRTVEYAESLAAASKYAEAMSILKDIDSLNSKMLALDPGTKSNEINDYTSRIDELLQKFDAIRNNKDLAFNPEQLAAFDAMLQQIDEHANNVILHTESVGADQAAAAAKAEQLRTEKEAYDNLIKAMEEKHKLEMQQAGVDPSKNSNEYAELERQIQNAAMALDLLMHNPALNMTQERTEEINRLTREYEDELELVRARMNDAFGNGGKNIGKASNRLENMIIRALALDNVLLKMFRKMKEMVKTAIEIDSAITQLRIVTNDSISDVRKYGETISEVAKEIGANIKDLVDSATVFARLGYTLDESVNLSKYSAMLKNVGDIDISAAQDSLTAITKAFNISANDIESVMDKMVVVGNNFPISVSQIAEGMNNAGSSLAAAGNSFEQSVALLTAANTTVQNVSKASTALRTLTARIRRTKVELDDLGESVETSKFDEVVSALSKHNVSLMDINGNYRTTYDIIKDIAAIWDDLSNIEQSAVAEQLAGTRQQNVFFSIVEQFQEASGAMAAMESSTGALQNSYDKYLLSMQAHTDMFKASLADLSTSIASSALIKTVVDSGTKIVSILAKITSVLDHIGGLVPVLSGFVTLIVTSHLDKILNVSLFSAAKESAAALASAGKLGLASIASAAPVIAGIAAALTAIVAIISKIKQNIEEARQSAVQAANDISQDRAQSRASLEDYIERIQELKEKAADTSISNRELYNVQYELLSIQDELIDKYGDQAEALNLIGDSAEETAQKLRDYQSETEKRNATIYLAENSDAINRARRKIEGNKTYVNDVVFTDTNVNQKYIDQLDTILEKYSAISMESTLFDGNIKEYDIIVNSDANDAQNQLIALREELMNLQDDAGKPLLYTFGNLSDALNDGIAATQAVIDKYQAVYDEYVQSMIVSDSTYSSIMADYAAAYQKYQEALKYPGSPSERNRQIQEALDEIDAIEKKIGEMDFLDDDGNIQVGVKNYFANIIGAFEEESEKQKLKLQVELDLDNNKELQDQLRTALEAFSADGTINKSDLMVSLNQMEAGDFSGVADSQIDAFKKLSVAAKMFNLDLSDLVDIFIDFGLVSNDVLSETEGNASKLSTFESQMASFANTAKDSMEDASESTATLADRIDHVVNALKPLADMQDGLADGFTIAAEQALEYAKTYPEILEGAQLAADGQVKLNEDVVNAFIDGKEAEIKSSLDADIAELEARREYEVARAKLAQMELDLAKGVRDGTIDLSEEQAVQLINDANQVLIAKLHDDGEVASSYEAAAVFMAEQAHKLGVYSTEVANALASNFVGATADAANTGGSNMTTLANTIVNVVKAAQEAARAIKGMASGDVRGSAATYSPGYGAVKNRTKNANMTDTGTGGRTQLYRDYANGNISLSAVQDALRNVNTYTFSSGVFTPSGFSYEATPATFERFISDLSDTVDIYNKTIAEIDGELALLQALRKQNLSDFKSDKSGSGSGGSGGSGGGSGGGSSTEDLEDALEAQKELFKKYLADVEHEIEVRSHFDNETKNIANLYVNLIHEVEEELKAARAMGLSDTDDYIQELQDKWIDYTEALKDLQDSVRDNAKDALDDLADIRVNMLKQEISDRKDALDKQLDMLKEFYDKQKDMLQDQYDEEKYLEEQAEKRKEVTKIQEELNRLEYDNSAWAQKRKLELAQELADAQKELDDFEKDHALDVAQEELDRLYEMQEKEIQNELDLLDEKEKDSKALYEQALEDIKNGSIELYNEMIKWNETYGDGIEDTIKNAWEEAYKALEEYKTLYDETFNGVNLENATGYTPANGPYDGSRIAGSGSSSGSGSGSSSGSSKAATPAEEKKSTPAAPALAVGTAVSVKSGTKWYADSYGGGRSGTAKGGKIKYINLKGTHPYNIDGLGWVKKTDIVGYAAGTRSALPGVHSVDERGDEYIFQSSDGSRYRLFSGGEKVLNARATNFLYDFANNGSQILQKLINAVSGGGLGAIRPIQNNVQLVTGDIIINGNTDKATISEIRRAQRESVELVLRQFNKFNK